MTNPMTYKLSRTQIDEAIGWRHHLHARPELGLQERETSAFISTMLRQWGYEVRDGYAKTGLVASLRKGSSPKAIGIRADMDALPINENSALRYASMNSGIMHACGHDGHVASALAAAKALVSEEFDGTIRFIFQPAEENEGGARMMVEEGLFKDHKIDAIFGMHNWPDLPLGTLVARPDQMMAAFGTFEITIKGRGGHAAMPHEGSDAIVAASHIIAALQTISSRSISPLQSAVVSVTQIHGGDAWNVIPGKVVLRGTTRWFDDAIGWQIRERIDKLAISVADGFCCEVHIDHQLRYPPTINNPDKARVVKEAAANLTELTVVDALPSMVAEDFAFMLRVHQGCYFWLGAARTEGENPGLHSDNFDFNDELLPVAANFWIALVQNIMR